ncbi:hypothetical protein CGK12_23535 [Vibrio parahaemolyticus]|nr:hypothetical protein CGK12_23535 [Vibrio parahaemolyticus]
MAFLVWVKFSVYGVQIQYRGSVAHPLIGRYKLQNKLSFYGINNHILTDFNSSSFRVYVHFPKISVKLRE